MIKNIQTLLIAFVIFLSFTTSSFAIEEKTELFQITSGKKTVKYVSFHPKEDYILQPVLANDKVGQVEDLENMALRLNGVAAINGTFFNADDQNDLGPQGSIMIHRNLEHLGGGVVAMGILSNSELIFSENDYIVKGGINGYREWPYSWYAWGVNLMTTDSNAIILFTPSYKNKEIINPNFTFIVVENGKVTEIVKDKATIPTDGFVIAFGPAEHNSKDIQRFNHGDTIEYWIEHPDNLKNALHMLSNAPKLVTDGKVDINFERDQVTDAKMANTSTQRSFIGKKENGTIIMGTVAQVTIPELAEIVVKLGVVEAINLDGGTSSGLYYNGKYTTTPGRKISNGLVVIPQKKAPRIEVNGTEIFLQDAAAYIENGTTMVPVRGVFEALGAEIDWDAKNQRVIAKGAETIISITVNQKSAEVNGAAKELLEPAVNKGGRVYIPLRFVAEALGANVEWDGNRNTVLIEASILKPE